MGAEGALLTAVLVGIISSPGVDAIVAPGVLMLVAVGEWRIFTSFVEFGGTELRVRGILGSQRYSAASIADVVVDEVRGYRGSASVLQILLTEGPRVPVCRARGRQADALSTLAAELRAWRLDRRRSPAT